MEALRTELLRLRRAYTVSRARDVARRADLAVLVAAVVLAFVSRALLVLPGFSASGHRFLLLLAVAGGLLLLRPALRLAARLFASPSPTTLAARLDDTFGWRDETATAASLRIGAARGGLGATPVETLLLAQSAGRLREIDPTRLWPSSVGGRRLRIVLVVVLLLILFLPGVGGLLGRGASGPRPGATGERPEKALSPEDADRWMREHGRLALRKEGDDPAATALAAGFTTDAPLPAGWRGRLELLWDGGPPIVLEDDVAEDEHATPSRTFRVDLARVAGLRGRLTPGEHRARVRLAPSEGPWREPLPSNEVTVVLQPPESGGSSAPEPPPPPEPKAPPSALPPPTPPPPKPEPEGDQPRETPPPPPKPREVVVTPLVGEGPTVKKQEAVVAVRDPEAGTKPPTPVPLEQALADFDRIVERAVPAERFRPADREFLRRYFEALRAAARGP